MSRLPFLISVPHAGLKVPTELDELNRLEPEAIARDGDLEAAEIFLPLEDHVSGLVTTAVARAFVDVNRAADDRSADGVVKTHTIFEEPVYRRDLPDELIDRLVQRYHHPYHERLSELALTGVVLGIDCHTMAAVAPPIADDAGTPRPAACLSNDGGTCPRPLLELMAARLEDTLGETVAINDPFRGGHVVRAHADELPWVQLEFRRGAFRSPREKGAAAIDVLHRLADAWSADESRG